MKKVLNCYILIFIYLSPNLYIPSLTSIFKSPAILAIWLALIFFPAYEKPLFKHDNQ